MIEAVKERIKKRMDGEEINDTIMDEINQTVTDRLCLRLGVEEDDFPSLFHSIAVDACIKLWRKRYYEGISTEGAANISTAFVDDVLSEYVGEIAQWRDDNAKRTVHFL